MLLVFLVVSVCWGRFRAQKLCRVHKSSKLSCSHLTSTSRTSLPFPRFGRPHRLFVPLLHGQRRSVQGPLGQLHNITSIESPLLNSGFVTTGVPWHLAPPRKAFNCAFLLDTPQVITFKALPLQLSAGATIHISRIRSKETDSPF
ncbi:hypothetical protein M501DRAFT_168535 [Patellaria atrata CBS 101060]|uniref:Secreted protein n=1 Tax=Patellaria atrata CBS 101060 TaxID=1346257 RepID=A0A9P4VRF3_9PEZI|nr:hypothetical protein M501DRAFT_168535 [Patellaria atrata CBS 101060]